MGALRKAKRDMAKAKMKQAGIIQPNKSKYRQVDDTGKPITAVRKSFFSSHWREG